MIRSSTGAATPTRSVCRSVCSVDTTAHPTNNNHDRRPRDDDVSSAIGEPIPAHRLDLGSGVNPSCVLARLAARTQQRSAEHAGRWPAMSDTHGDAGRLKNSFGQAVPRITPLSGSSGPDRASCNPVRTKGMKWQHPSSQSGSIRRVWLPSQPPLRQPVGPVAPMLPLWSWLVCRVLLCCLSGAVSTPLGRVMN
jgi:hypothetical protein